METTISILASDLDGTLIPLEQNEQNRIDLSTLSELLQQHSVPLVYVTGRHLASAIEAMTQHELPPPLAIICDVGSTICMADDKGKFAAVNQYHLHLKSIVSAFPFERLKETLASHNGLTLQEPQKQGKFKLSFYAKAEETNTLVTEIVDKLERTGAPWNVISSIDPFNGDGLIDLLPCGVSKAFALSWWIERSGQPRSTAIFAGDSGNDFDALSSGCRAILVGNAKQELVAEVQAKHDENGWVDRLYVARGHATSGLLEGCRAFGLFEPDEK